MAAQYTRPELEDIERALLSGGGRCVIVRAEPWAGMTTMHRQLSARVAQRHLSVIDTVSDAMRDAATADRSAIVLVDDLHLLDRMELATLRERITTPPPHIAGSVVFVHTSGPDVDDAVEDTIAALIRHGATSFELAPLDESQLALLAASLLGGQPDDELLTFLYPLCAGLPAAMQLAVQALEYHELVTRHAGRIIMREPPLFGVVSGLPQPARHYPREFADAIGGLAVLGRFDPETVALLADHLQVGRDHVEKAIDHLIRLRILRPTTQGYDYAYPLMRSSLFGAGGPMVRAGIHRLAVTRFADTSALPVGERVELAHHLAESIGPGDTDDAVRLAVLARQMMGLVPRWSLHMLNRAVACLPHGSEQRTAAMRDRLALLQLLGRHQQVIDEADTLLDFAASAELLDGAGMALITALLLDCRWSTARAVAAAVDHAGTAGAHHRAALHALVLMLDRAHGLAVPQIELARQSPVPLVQVLAANAASFAVACGSDLGNMPPDPLPITEMMALLAPHQQATASAQVAFFHALTGDVGVVKQMRQLQALPALQAVVRSSDMLLAVTDVAEGFAMLVEGRWRELAERLPDLQRVGLHWSVLGVVVDVIDAEMSRGHDHYRPSIALTYHLDRVPALAPLLASSAVAGLAAAGHLTEALRVGDEQLDNDRAADGHLFRHRLLAVMCSIEPNREHRRELLRELDRIVSRTGSPWATVQALTASAREYRDLDLARAAAGLAAATGAWPSAHAAAVLCAELGEPKPDALVAALAWAGENRHHNLYLRAARALRDVGRFPPAGGPRRPHDPTEMDRLLIIAVARGETNQQIADRLGLGVGTVKTYLQRLYRKLEVSNRSEFVAVTARQGWR